MNKALKQKYKADFSILTELINSFDPCGLIGGGAPSNEYDCLTQQILNSVYNKRSRQELKELIHHEIEHHFGTLDLATLDEPNKTHFNNNIDKLLSDLEDKFYKNTNEHNSTNV